MNAKDLLEELAVQIDNQLKKILEQENSISSEISPIIKEVIDNSSVVCFGGKRLRGAFAYYSYLMHGGKNKKEILKVAAILEMLHSYLLAHDDVMDLSDMRHRKPTIHKIYENKAKTINSAYQSPEHFGENIAISMGDVLCHLGLDILTRSNFDDSLKIRALTKINREFADTGYGQIIDCFGSILKNVTEEHVMLVHYYKTGKYTYETPLHIGAILAGCSDKDLKVLSEYAIPGGIAFQIQDDILGMYGDEYRIGKPADSDLKEGKKTLLIVKALEKATTKQKKIILNNLGNNKLKKQDLIDTRNVIIDTGSLEYSKNIALELVKKAKQALIKHKNLKWEKDGEDFLNGIADYMINRDL